MGIIPALAGNTSRGLGKFAGVTDHPRSRGEYTWFITEDAVPDGSSPLSRGIRSRLPRPLRSRRIIPALAGNTKAKHPTGGAFTDHPRSRGEYLGDFGLLLGGQGSSPLSRGIRTCPGRPSSALRIIPALAGNTTRPKTLVTGGGDHPRSRGEYRIPDGPRNAFQGSSPLSRGILLLVWGIAHGARIIPALAGNTGRGRAASHGPADHPRSRGEYTAAHGLRWSGSGSSPLSRGIRCFAAGCSVIRGIIPALAGNTTAPREARQGRRDHPRSRGEYKTPDLRIDPVEGSSPLSRGIHAPV